MANARSILACAVLFLALAVGYSSAQADLSLSDKPKNPGPEPQHASPPPPLPPLTKKPEHPPSPPKPKKPEQPPHSHPPPKPKKPKKPKKVKCHHKKLYPYCSGVKFNCPPSCPQSCYMDCQKCSPVCSCDKPGGVCQDPRFVGGDGITFYFHGKKDRDFCIVTDSEFHVNAHFIGKRDPAKTRDYTWVQSIAILSGENHRLYLGAKKTATWHDSVDRLDIAYDGLPIHLETQEGATWQSPDEPTTSVVRSSGTNGIIVEVEGVFRITANVVPITEEESRVHNYGMTPEDCFAHLELGFKFYSLTGEVDGVLGQTYREGYVSRVKMSSAMPIMGGDDKFSTSDIYTPDCVVARYGQKDGGIASVVQREEMKCFSGVSGTGVVCK